MDRTWTAYAPLPLRLVFGGALMVHGIDKLMNGVGGFAGMLGSMGIPAPTLAAWVTVLLEVVGGLMLVVGAFVGVVSVLLILEMLVAMVTVHLPNGFFFTNQPPGVEVNLLYVAGLLALVLGGAGALSVDAARKRRAAGPTP